MRPRSVLVLLILVLGLIAFIWFYERKLPSSSERAELARRVMELESKDITAIEIHRQQQVVRLEKVAEESSADAVGEAEWRLVQPLTARADGAQVERLLDDLTGLEKTRTLDDVGAAELGLESPRARVRLLTATDAVEVRVGSEIPASSSMIVGLEDENVAYVVGDSVWAELSRPPGDWRSRDAFSFRRDEVDRVTVTRGDRRLLLARRGTEFWLESPIADRADSDAIQDFLASLTGLRIDEFLDAPGPSLAELGLDPPVAELEILLQERQEPVRLQWGGSVPEAESRHFARVETLLFETESDLGDLVERSVEDWRSRAVTSLETYQIDKVEVVSPGSDRLALERAGADWKRNDDRVSFDSVSELLYALTDLEARELLFDAEARGRGLELVEPTLELTLSGSERVEQVSFYAALGDEVPVRASDRPVVQMVSSEAVEEILAKIEKVRAAESRTAPVEDIDAPSSSS